MLLGGQVFSGGSFLLTDSFLHVHSICPLGLNLVNQDFKIFFIFESLITRWELTFKYLFLAYFISTLLSELQGLAQPVHLANTIVMIAAIVVVAEAVLLLRGLNG